MANYLSLSRWVEGGESRWCYLSAGGVSVRVMTIAHGPANIRSAVDDATAVVDDRCRWRWGWRRWRLRGSRRCSCRVVYNIAIVAAVAAAAIVVDRVPLASRIVGGETGVGKRGRFPRQHPSTVSAFKDAAFTVFLDRFHL